MHDLMYDAIHDEIVVTSPLTQAILTFRGGAHGDEPPVRVILGAKTGILGVGAMDKVTIDAHNSEIFLATARHNVLVFPREANGNVAPIRVLSGPDTLIKFGEQTDGGGNVPAIRVDPIRDLLIVPAGGGLLIFDRKASGNTKPLRVIRGPKTGSIGRGQIEIHPPTGYILAMQNGGISIWNVQDNGDVAPRFRIPVGEIIGLGGTLGVALNPPDKEVIVANSRNRVLTFYFPEIF